jgi:hypothetical protein
MRAVLLALFAFSLVGSSVAAQDRKIRMFNGSHAKKVGLFHVTC